MESCTCHCRRVVGDPPQHPDGDPRAAFVVSPPFSGPQCYHDNVEMQKVINIFILACVLDEVRLWSVSGGI